MCGKKLLLKNEDWYEVKIPNYSCVPCIQKTYLLEYCKSKKELLEYLPDTTNLINISRDFLLKVRILIIIY